MLRHTGTCRTETQQQRDIPASPQHYYVGVVVRCVGVAQIREEDVELNRVLLSPQLDEPVEDKEDEQAEEQHVAQQFSLTASGQLLHSANGGTEQAACRVKVRVLECERSTESVKSRQSREHSHCNTRRWLNVTTHINDDLINTFIPLHFRGYHCTP